MRGKILSSSAVVLAELINSFTINKNEKNMITPYSEMDVPISVCLKCLFKIRMVISHLVIFKLLNEAI